MTYPLDITDLDEALGMLGARMFRRRTELGVTLEQVAKLAGTTKSYVWDIEQGKSRNPTIRNVWRLAHALRWTMDELIGLSDERPALSADAMRIAVQIDDAIQRALDNRR